MADLREQIEQEVARLQRLVGLDLARVGASHDAGQFVFASRMAANAETLNALRAALASAPAPSLAEARREAAPEVLAAIDEVLGAPLGPSTIVIDLARERLREVRRALASPPQKDTRSNEEG